MSKIKISKEKIAEIMKNISDNVNGKIVFLSYFGSNLYGLANENSDIDIKGVYIPNIEDALSGKYVSKYSYSSGDSSSKNSKDDIDISIYSIQNFNASLAKGDPNALDILFAASNKDAIILISDFWENEIANNNKLFNMDMAKKSMFGYAYSQLKKYGVSGSPYHAFIFAKKYFLNSKEQVLSKEVIDDLSSKYKEHMKDKIHFDAKNKSIDRIKPVSHHDKNAVLINALLFIEDVAIKHILESLEKNISKFNINKNLNDINWKAVSHAARIIVEMDELIEKSSISFPIKDSSYIKQIKLGERPFEEVEEYIEKGLSRVESYMNKIEENNIDKDSYSDEVNDKILVNYYMDSIAKSKK